MPIASRESTPVRDCRHISTPIRLVLGYIDSLFFGKQILSRRSSSHGRKGGKSKSRESKLRGSYQGPLRYYSPTKRAGQGAHGHGVIRTSKSAKSVSCNLQLTLPLCHLPSLDSDIQGQSPATFSTLLHVHSPCRAVSAFSLKVFHGCRLAPSTVTADRIVLGGPLDP